MTGKRQIPSVFSKGFVLCSPKGELQANAWGDTEADAIATKFRRASTRAARWEKAQAKGWTVQFVYVRFFVPVFKSTFTTPEISEVYDDQDI